MAAPTTRQEFKERVLRKLGKPVLEINVADEQVEDCVDESLRFFHEHHYDGSVKQYYKHQVTDVDKANKYITLPENIIGAVRVFPIWGLYTGNDGLFNIQYQIALNDLYTITSQQLAPYYIMMSGLQLYEEILVGKIPSRYNRHQDRLYIDMQWDRIDTGNYLLIEAHEVIDPEVYSDVWSDRWLTNYCAALVKQQWGTNLKKFDGMQLPGGLKFNGQKIYDEATEDRQMLEKEIITNLSNLDAFLTG
jgi:hypothetical protein